MKRITKIFLLTIMLLVCGVAVGSIKPAAAAAEDDAVSKAKSYTKYMGFSRDGLVDQLEFDGFSHEDAEYGADNCGADWNKMAVKKAESYTGFMGFSRDGLVDQLEFDQFTKEEAEYGADNCGADWNEMAVTKAKSYLSFMDFTEDRLSNQLKFDGFTDEQIAYAIDVIYGSSNAESPANTPTAIPTNTPTSVQDDSLTESSSSEDTSASISAASSTEASENTTAASEFTNVRTDEPTATPVPVADTNEVSDQMIDVMAENIENIFVIRGLEEPFNNPMPSQYSDVGDATVVDINNQEGSRNISLYANADNVHDYSSVAKLNAGNLQNFYFEMEVRVNDVYPAGSGGCFIGYTNQTTSAVQEEDIKTIGLLVDGSGAEFYVKGNEADSGEHIQLERSSGRSNTLVLIRFTGQTFAYVNGNYAGQYHDDLSGPFQLVYGSTAFSDGDNALCSFDNLIIRKVTN